MPKTIKRKDAIKKLHKMFPANTLASFDVRPDIQLAMWYARHILGDGTVKVNIKK